MRKKDKLFRTGQDRTGQDRTGQDRTGQADCAFVLSYAGEAYGTEYIIRDG